MKEKVEPKSKKVRFTLITGILAAVLLVIANSGFWANRYLFNENNFSDVTVQALTSDSSRAAIAGALTTTIYQNRPVARTLLSDPTNELLNNMLNSQRTKNALDTVATKLNIMLTSKEKKVISLDLTTVKSILTKLAGATDGKSAERLDPSTIPDEIVLFDASKLPDLYKYSTALLIISPVSLLAALVLLVLPYIKDRADWRRIIRLQGLVVAVAGALALCIGPIFRPMILGSVSKEAQRTVLANVYDAFIATFNSQTIILLVVGVILVISPWVYDWLMKLLHLIASKTKSNPKATPGK